MFDIDHSVEVPLFNAHVIYTLNALSCATDSKSSATLCSPQYYMS